MEGGSLMAGIGGVVVQFRADADQAIRETKKFVGSLKDVDSQSKKTGDRLKKGLKVGALAAAAGVAGLAVAAVDFAKAAYTDAQAAAKLERTLKSVKGVTDEAADSAAAWVDRMELLTTIADDDLRVALSRLVLVTDDLTDAQKLTALAADASVGSGREFATVAAAMAKAAGGNVAALKRLFPQLDAGPDKILTFEEAMDQLRDTYKGAAKDAADNDLFGRLAKAWDQIKEAAGQAALPSLEEVSSWFSDPKNIDDIQTWIGKLGEWSRSIGEDFKGKIEDLIDYLGSPAGKQQIEEMQTALEGIAGAIVSVTEAVSKAGPVLDFFRGIQGDVISTNAGQEYLDRAIVERDAKNAAIARGKPVAQEPAVPTKGTINVTVNNGKQEPALDSAALAIRLARNIPQ
jgi:hypothetical protein